MRRPSWTYEASIYRSGVHYLLYRDETLGVHLQVVTRRKGLFSARKARQYFFVDGRRRIYRSEERLLAALVNRADRAAVHVRGAMRLGRITVETALALLFL
jgi:hypothetical protein